MLVTNVRGFEIPSSSVLKFEGPQKTWGYGSDSVGRDVPRPYGAGKVCVPFRGLLTDSEGKMHWWGNRESNQILDVTSSTKTTLTFPILDAQQIQYAYWWSPNHHFYRWRVKGREISRSDVFLSDSQGQPIMGTNYISSQEELTWQEHQALANA